MTYDAPAPLPNLRHVAAALAVRRVGTVTRASLALNLTQPAVSQALERLERQTGGMLFYREASGMVPTPALERAAPYLERLLEDVRQGLTDAGATSERSVTATQLRAILDLSEHGSLAAAARARSTSRATLHRPIRELQAVLGIPLLESTSHGLRPTRTATRLARRIHLAAAAWRAARAEVSAHGGPERGSTVIGAMPLARSVVVPQALLALARTYPSHRISILDGAYESLFEALLDGRADILVGALRDAAPPSVLQTPLLDDPLVIVGRFDHPLARSPATRRALRAAAWVAPRANSPLRRRFDDLVGGDGDFAPIECNSLVAARELLLSSDRLLLVSRHQVRRDVDSGVLAQVQHPFGPMSRAIGLTQRRDWIPTTAQRCLLSHLVSEASSVASLPPPP